MKDEPKTLEDITNVAENTSVSEITSVPVGYVLFWIIRALGVLAFELQVRK